MFRRPKKDHTFRQQPHHRARGRVGEDAAVSWLKDHGYRMVARNVSNKIGEIDVIALDGEVLCFLEIKARSGREFGSAIEAISPHKMRQIARTAALYLAQNPTTKPCRFDVLAMDLVDEAWVFHLIRDAFTVPFRSLER